MSAPRFIRLAAGDNVVVAVDQILAGSNVAGALARERVPRGHKMAVAAIQPNEPVRKYGQIIGFASKSITPGDWVHEHNVFLHDFARDYRFAEAAKNDEVLPLEQRATFEGYLRPNGKTGTRNYIGVLTSVNCSASVAKFIAEAVNRSGVLGRLSRHRRRGPLRARHRLRHGGEGRGLGRVAPHPVRLCHPSQSRRDIDGRAWLRGVPDRPHEETNMAWSRATISRP